MSDYDQAALRGALSTFYLSQRDGDYATANEGLTVVQYWNDEPDEQVASLIKNTRQKSEALDFRHVLFNEQEARNFLNDRFGPRSLSAFDKSFHQAQKSDIFRYHYLLAEGGVWIDADMTICGDLTKISKKGACAFSYKNKSTGRLSNRMIWSPPGVELMKFIVNCVLENMEDESLLQKCKEERDILSLSGPKIVNYSFMEFFEDPNAPSLSRLNLFLVDEVLFSSVFVSAKNFLGEELHYKKTNRSWQNWASEVPGSPISLHLEKIKFFD